MKFVLVNGRTPRTQSFCVLCCESIGESYLRNIATRLAYCNHKCYVDHCKVLVLSLHSNIMRQRHDDPASKYLPKMCLSLKRGRATEPRIIRVESYVQWPRFCFCHNHESFQNGLFVRPR